MTPEELEVLIYHRITDWTDAYANSAHIVGSEIWPGAWADAATAFRKARQGTGRVLLDHSYGSSERNRLDLFLPDQTPKGLAVFIHGGYWLALDKSYFSHFAQGALCRGYAVAVPSYRLCPEQRIAGITREIGAAISAAAELVDGPICITGHSAGGHLAARMACLDTPLSGHVVTRLRNVIPISGLHELRPLMETEMNATLRLDETEVAAESPALLRPIPGIRIGCWVGRSERPEFLRQSRLLANIWTGLGASTSYYAEPNKHHFNILDGLLDPNHPLTMALVSA
jgi:acetyl esterase/lipase